MFIPFFIPIPSSSTIWSLIAILIMIGVGIGLWNGAVFLFSTYPIITSVGTAAILGLSALGHYVRRKRAP
jgi:hypothetical protein